MDNEALSVRTCPNSGIANEPVLYAVEIGEPDYVLMLLLSVIEVSVHSSDTANSLPRP